MSQALDVVIDPSTGELEATSALEIEVLDESPRRSIIEFELHPELSVTSVTADGAILVNHETLAERGERATGLEPARLRLLVDEPSPTVRFDIAYRGTLQEDVQAGEAEGSIHNFAVQAHIGEDGLYLEPNGFWYPRLRAPKGIHADEWLTSYDLVTDAIEGYELVAGLEAVTAEPGTAESGSTRLRWQSPFPLDGLVLLGGPLERRSRDHDGIALHAVVAPGKEAIADDILTASAEILDRYEPLLGDYPFREFTVLEAFFSSGFAFPTCTQIAGPLLNEHQQYRRHGYLDHELLHNWWGNGVLVDPDDGNWCEGLTTYLANYGGHVIDGNEAEARKQRRNYSNFLSSIEPAKDKPLGTFGLKGGAGRGIGYQKGAAVFHMLERKIGSEAFLEGLQTLTHEQMGRHIGWEIIREAMERASGTELSVFFENWVRTGGSPRLDLAAAEWRPGKSEVLVTLRQSGTNFELDVPLRLHYEDRWVDEVVTIGAGEEKVMVPSEPSGLVAIELDPDYQLFRRLEPEQIMPTSALTRRAKKLLIVLPDGELAEPYRTVADSFRRAVLGDDPATDPGQVIERHASSLKAADLAETSVLILGEAMGSDAIKALLARTRSPVRWQGSSFEIGDQSYDESGQAAYFTVHHPDRPELGITAYFGNSERALSNARVLNFYPHSLLVFDTPEGPAYDASSGMPRARVLERVDLEFPDRIDF